MSDPTTLTGGLPQREPATEPPGRPAPGDQPEMTGDPAVDAELARLARVDTQLDPAEQLPMLAEIHEALQQRLSSTEG